MNIHLDPISIPSLGRAQGINTFASYDRLVSMLIQHEHVRLNEDEHITAVVVSAQGLTFQIEEKKP